LSNAGNEITCMNIENSISKTKVFSADSVPYCEG